MGCGVVPSIGELDMWRALRAEIVCWVRFVTVINVFVLERKLGGRDRDREKVPNASRKCPKVRKCTSSYPFLVIEYNYILKGL